MTKDEKGHTMADLSVRLREVLTALRLDKEDLDHDQLSGLRNALDGAFEDGYAEGEALDGDLLMKPEALR